MKEARELDLRALKKSEVSPVEKEENASPRGQGQIGAPERKGFSPKSRGKQNPPL